MKRSSLLSSKTRMAFMIACSSIMLFASCSKKNDIQPDPVGELEFKVVNTVLGSAAQDVAFNAAVKVTALPYGVSSDYFKVISGVSTIGFYDTGTTAQANVGGQIQLPIGAKVSAFYYKVPDGTLSAVFYNDATVVPTAGKVKVRFINLNNILNNTISVAVDGATGGAALVPSIKFTENSAFFEVDPGAKFNFTATGITAGPAFDGGLLANKIYTIWVDGTASSLTGHVVANN